MDAWIYLHGSQFKRNYYTVFSKNDGAFTFEFFGNTLDGSKLKPYTNPQNGQLESLGAQALFGLWFEAQMGGNTKICDHVTIGCTLPAPMFQNDYDEIIRKVVSDQLTFPNYANCLGWMATRQALGWIVRSNLQNSATYANYWAQKTNTSAGILAQFELNSMDWEQSQATLESQINTKWSNVQQLLSNGTLSPTQLEMSHIMFIQVVRLSKSVGMEKQGRNLNFKYSQTPIMARLKSYFRMEWKRTFGIWKYST